jgi:hypothetical protein
MKSLSSGRREIDEQGTIMWRSAATPSVYAGYMLHHQSERLGTSGRLETEIQFTNVAAMVEDVLTRISRERAELRAIASYFHSVPGLAGDERGTARVWPFRDVLSQIVQAELARLDSQAPQMLPLVGGAEDKSDFWSEWHSVFSW